LGDPVTYASGPAGEVDGRLRAELGRLPLFPLPEVVLFPHALLRLHIFERRYRVMVGDALRGPRFIVMAALADEPGGDADRPAVLAVAGVGEIVMSHELPDGRFNIVLRGRARVHIVDEQPSSRPYRIVATTVLPDVALTTAAELRDADQALRALLARLADALPDGGALLRGVAAEASTTELVDGVTAALITDPPLRQRLLETLDVAARIERVAAEVVAMTARLDTSNRPAN
jgi:Lon protease-like protein